MGKEVKESFQLLDKLSIESWKFERLENDLLFAGGLFEDSIFDHVRLACSVDRASASLSCAWR